MINLVGKLHLSDHFIFFFIISLSLSIENPFNCFLLVTCYQMQRIYGYGKKQQTTVETASTVTSFSRSSVYCQLSMMPLSFYYLFDSCKWPLPKRPRSTILFTQMTTNGESNVNRWKVKSSARKAAVTVYC